MKQLYFQSQCSRLRQELHLVQRLLHPHHHHALLLRREAGDAIAKAHQVHGRRVAGVHMRQRALDPPFSLGLSSLAVHVRVSGQGHGSLLTPIRGAVGWPCVAERAPQVGRFVRARFPFCASTFVVLLSTPAPCSFFLRAPLRRAVVGAKRVAAVACNATCRGVSAAVLRASIGRRENSVPCPR